MSQQISLAKSLYYVNRPYVYVKERLFEKSLGSTALQLTSASASLWDLCSNENYQVYELNYRGLSETNNPYGGERAH